MITLLRPVPLVRAPYYAGRQARRALGQAPQQAMDLAEKLRHDGALVTVLIGTPASVGGGTPQTVKAMVDTGASISTVTDAVATAAGLKPHSSIQVGGVGGTSERPVYAASLTLPEYGTTVDPVEIAGVSLPLPGVDMLVGRDVLRVLRLDWRGGAGAFLLTKTGASEALTPGGAAAAPAPAGGGGGISSGTATLIGAGAVFLLVGALAVFKAI